MGSERMGVVMNETNNYDTVHSLLEVKGLKTYFYTDEGEIRAVNGVSFTVEPGETVGIVGESGCGKSVTVRSIMRLIKQPPGKIVDGKILFKGRNLLKIPEREMQSIRGKDISMIFQEPMTSLNPVYKIGYQIEEVLLRHYEIGREEAEKKVLKLLRMVEIPDPEKRINDYPHQLSGGMRQRIVIAMAIACKPKLIIADEPTTALDVTIQAQILSLMNKMKQEFGTSILLITHDLGVIAEMCDKVVIMYGGHVVEQADVKTIFLHPKHPYTIGLLKSLPRIDEDVERLYTIKGMVPSPKEFSDGCRFHPRCEFCEATRLCTKEQPELIEVESGHFVACHCTDKVK